MVAFPVVEFVAGGVALVDRGAGGNWYARGANGEIYRFSPDNVGGAHFSGMTGGEGGIPPNRIPIAVRRGLGFRR